jgi:hypothetical protein
MRRTSHSPEGTYLRVGAAHLKKWDTPPPKKSGVPYTFVDKMSTLSTGRNKGLKDFLSTNVDTSLTLLTHSLTKLTGKRKTNPGEKQTYAPPKRRSNRQNAGLGERSTSEFNLAWKTTDCGNEALTRSDQEIDGLGLKRSSVG